MNRRSILKLLGMAPTATSSLVVKEMADGRIAQAAGIAFGTFISGTNPAKGPSGITPQVAALAQLYKHGKVFMPDWFTDIMRERHCGVYSLDPDIACKKSWSMAVKILTQKERNIARGTATAFNYPIQHELMRQFAEKTGWWI